MRKKILITLFILTAMLPISQEVEAQCPMCRAGVESSMKDQKNKAVGTGLNNGILFLLASPYVLIGTALFIWRRKSKNQKSNDSLTD